MTALLFLVAPGSWAGAMAGTTVSIGGLEGHHAVSVHRLRIGEEVLVGDGAGVRVSAEVVGVERHTLLTRVIEVQVRPPADPRFVLVQALAKGDRDEQAIEAATELGVDAVVPWQASRSVVQWRADKVARGQARWESIVVAAAKQSRRFQVPQVRPWARTADAVRLLGDAALGIVLHEEAQAPLASSTCRRPGRSCSSSAPRAASQQHRVGCLRGGRRGRGPARTRGVVDLDRRPGGAGGPQRDVALALSPASTDREGHRLLGERATGRGIRLERSDRVAARRQHPEVLPPGPTDGHPAVAVVNPCRTIAPSSRNSHWTVPSNARLALDHHVRVPHRGEPARRRDPDRGQLPGRVSRSPEHPSRYAAHHRAGAGHVDGYRDAALGRRGRRSTPNACNGHLLRVPASSPPTPGALRVRAIRSAATLAVTRVPGVQARR